MYLLITKIVAWHLGVYCLERIKNPIIYTIELNNNFGVHATIQLRKCNKTDVSMLILIEHLADFAVYMSNGRD